MLETNIKQLERSYIVGDILEKGLVISYKTKHMPQYVYDPVIPLLNVYSRTESKCSQKDLYTNVRRNLFEIAKN